MKTIITNHDFKLLGTDQTFPQGKYRAIDATNQPNWKERGAVFIVNANGCDLLLERGDYTIVRYNTNLFSKSPQSHTSFQRQRILSTFRDLRKNHGCSLRSAFNIALDENGFQNFMA